jgi:hypothetical protein
LVTCPGMKPVLYWIHHNNLKGSVSYQAGDVLVSIQQTLVSTGCLWRMQRWMKAGCVPWAWDCLKLLALLLTPLK